MRYTGGKSLTWFQRTKKDETRLHGPMSFVQQASADDDSGGGDGETDFYIGRAYG